MHSELWVITSLGVIMGLVLFLPFLSKKVEAELEIFLFIMGAISVSISGLWNKTLIYTALWEPVKITLAVLVAGLIFKAGRNWLRKEAEQIKTRFGLGWLVFLLVTGLGMVSSMITAIIAALVLAEIIGLLKLARSLEVKLAILACYAIGLGAALTPLGEPLSTLAIAKLKSAPHHADFLFLFRLLGWWIMPALIGLGLAAMFLVKKYTIQGRGLSEDHPETYFQVLLRTVKVYFFVMALILLGHGFTPIVDKYMVKIPAAFLYWINMVSAILDNATLTAAEISPFMSRETIKYMLLGLLISGGMLIPGNIPNIICAGKLSIKSREWAVFGLPLGLGLMAVYFIILLFVK